MLLSAIASHPVVASRCNLFPTIYSLFIPFHSNKFGPSYVSSGSLTCTWQSFQRTAISHRFLPSHCRRWFVQTIDDRTWWSCLGKTMLARWYLFVAIRIKCKSCECCGVQLKCLSGTEFCKNYLEEKRRRRNSCAGFVDTVLLHCH